MEAANLDQMLKLLSQSHLPVLQGLADKHDVERLRMEFRTQLSELKKQGFPPLPIWTRFKRVGRMVEYNTLYGLYCLDAHNNIAALAARHFSDAGDAVSLFREMDRIAICNRMTSGLDYLLSSSVMIHSAFRTGEQGVDALHARFNRERLAGRFVSRTGP